MNPRSIQEVFADERNADPFRMAIIGWTTIEDMLEDALADAFHGELPKEVRGFNLRASLAEALNLIPAELRGPLGVVKKLRDEFAHGQRQGLDVSDGKVLWKAMREIAPEIERAVPELKDEYPAIILSSLLLVLQEALLASFEDAAEHRAQQEEAMREWRRQRALTPEQITELLRDVGQSD